MNPLVSVFLSLEHYLKKVFEIVLTQRIFFRIMMRNLFLTLILKPWRSIQKNKKTKQESVIKNLKPVFFVLMAVINLPLYLFEII